MEATETQTWVENARAAARALRAREGIKPQPSEPLDFPPVPAESGGFRSLAETQDLEILHEKGLIVDIYL